VLIKRIQTYPAPGITVTFDPSLCIHSAVCINSLPAVFDVRRQRWVRPEAATAPEVAATIDRCPSGALKYVLEGSAETTTDASNEPVETTIQASVNGPLLVQGTFQLQDENGREVSSSGRAALCRCGATTNQPFCDGSHKRIGFESKKKSAV
jgi:uncharacterized Fe-S cluster protein YjdI/CDGSH-type Zn-finger protein